VLSGVSGSGKTSACGVAESLARAAGRTVGGVLCRAVFEGGRKVGIDARDLAGGPDSPAAPLARARPDAGPTRAPAFDDADPVALRYGMWEFYKAALSAADGAAAAFIAAAREEATPALAVVDEIGPLELDRNAGMTRTLAALDGAARAPARPVACLVVARPDIADRLALRWSGSARIEMDGLSYLEAAEAAIAALGIARSATARKLS